MRGQSSIEYLATYGWAILVLGIVISVLFLGGFLNPQGNVKEYCITPPQIGCSSFASYVDGGNTILKLRFSNNFGYKVKITRITANYKGNEVPVSLNKEIEQGDSEEVTFVFREEPKPPQNTVAQYRITFNYVPCASEINPECSTTEGIGPYKLNANILAVVLGK